jgi:hypothetical protein
VIVSLVPVRVSEPGVAERLEGRQGSDPRHAGDGPAQEADH